MIAERTPTEGDPNGAGWTRRWVARCELDALCGHRLGDAALDGLWVAGTLEGLRAPAIAVVGSRAPSDEARRRARRLGEALGRSGVCVVSGLALGVDGAAHEGALAAGAPTVGVLGGGHDHFFPPRHRELGTRISTSGGAVVSPYPPDNHPEPWQFLARNAVIAMLADAIVVVEAAARSGALNTAGHGADRGIPVLAFPGDVERPKAAGCNALIRDGATLVRDVDDILAALPSGFFAAPRRRRRIAPVRAGDPPLVERILRALGGGPLDAGTLADRLDAPATAILPALTELELAERIRSGPDGYAALSP